MTIRGGRRLIFGIFTVSCVAVVEVLVENGWSKAGALALIMLGSFYYGPNVMDAATRLFLAVKGKLLGSSDDAKD